MGQERSSTADSDTAVNLSCTSWTFLHLVDVQEGEVRTCPSIFPAVTISWSFLYSWEWDSVLDKENPYMSPPITAAKGFSAAVRIGGGNHYLSLNHESCDSRLMKGQEARSTGWKV